MPDAIQNVFTARLTTNLTATPPTLRPWKSAALIFATTWIAGCSSFQTAGADRVVIDPGPPNKIERHRHY